MEIKTYYKKEIDEKLYFKEMDSGLKIYFIPKKGYTKKQAIFATKYGSIDNVFIPIDGKVSLKVPEGIAHFLEHKLFEEPEEDIFHKFSQLGSDVNAYTSFNQTAYLFNTTDNFYESLEILINFVQNPYFTDGNIEKEKGIIGQEIDMYRDNPGWRVFFNCLNGMYKEHPIKIDIAGTIDSIKEINKELLYKSYNTFYHPSNMVLVIVGDLSFNKIIDIVDKSERKDYEKLQSINRIFPEEPESINLSLIEENMVVSTPIFNIGFKDNQCGLKGIDQIKKDLITNIILEVLFGSSAIFFNELYDEGIIDNSFGSYYTGKETYGHSLIVGESNKPKEVYKRILKLLEKPIETTILEESFQRIKKNSIGEFLMGCNSIGFLANNYVDLYFDDFILLDYLDVLESIKYKDLIKRFKEHFKKDNVVLSIINPLNK
ncbi:MAG TPA: pitrilysin family protein [Tissierellaceae bacterium]|nr:pitrilysin family protein [Tissierellaceae bacterium]